MFRLALETIILILMMAVCYMVGRIDGLNRRNK